MKPNILKELLERRPFQPFELRMSNGDVFQVRCPNYAFVHRTMLFIGDLDADTVAFCALDQIASVNILQAA
jgi:hypothetical protein